MINWISSIAYNKWFSVSVWKILSECTWSIDFILNFDYLWWMNAIFICVFIVPES